VADDISKLKSQLLTSGLQKDNNALYQVIWGIIEALQKVKAELAKLQ